MFDLSRATVFIVEGNMIITSSFERSERPGMKSRFLASRKGSTVNLPGFCCNSIGVRGGGAGGRPPPRA